MVTVITSYPRHLLHKFAEKNLKSSGNISQAQRIQRQDVCLSYGHHLSPRI